MEANYINPRSLLKGKVSDEFQKAMSELDSCRVPKMRHLHVAGTVVRGLLYGNYNLENLLGEQLIWIATDKPLSEISDEGMIALSEGFTKQQVAIQQENVVMVNMPLYKKMNDRSKAALILHEVLLRAVIKIAPKHHQIYGTAKVRELVRTSFYSYDNPGSITEDMFERLCGENGSVWNEQEKK